MSLLKWFSSSLPGNVLGFEVAVSLPVFLVLLHQNYAQWTVGWTLYAAFLSLVMGALCGAVYWCVVTRPLLKRRHSGHS
jgi:hypothetical protein